MDQQFGDVCGNGLFGNASLELQLVGLRSNGTTNMDTISELESSTNGLRLPPKPKEPDYESYAARLASFNAPEWPADSCPVAAHLLAAAGFFYYGRLNNWQSFISSRVPGDLHFVLTFSLFLLVFFLTGNHQGYQDSVRCFHCGIGLCRWQPGDDAWSEHELASGFCMYILNSKNKLKYNLMKSQVSVDTEEINEVQFAPKQTPINQLTPPNSQESETNTSNNQLSNTSLKSTTSLSGTSENLITALTTSTKNALAWSRLTCKVCLQEELSVLFLPCRHLVSCTSCAAKVTTCPTCRREIKATIEAYIS